MNGFSAVGAAEASSNVGGVVETEIGDYTAHCPPEVTVTHVAPAVGRAGMGVLHLHPKILECVSAASALCKQIGEAKSELPSRWDRPGATYFLYIVERR